jgi:hypothetical protein
MHAMHVTFGLLLAGMIGMGEPPADEVVRLTARVELD